MSKVKEHMASDDYAAADGQMTADLKVLAIFQSAIEARHVQFTGPTGTLLALAQLPDALQRIHDALYTRLADAVQPAAGEGGLREAMERIAELNPSKANAHSAWDLHCTVKAIAKTALADAALSTSVPTGVVEIKPLEWADTLVDRGDGSSDVDGWEAETAFGACYGIEIDFGTDSYLFRLSFDGILIDCFEDENAAKGFAQTHFAARIRACLIAPPAQEATR